MKWSKNGFFILLAVISLVSTGWGEEPQEKTWKVQAGWVHQWGRGMKVSGPAPSLYKDTLGNGQETPAGWNYADGYVLPDEQSGISPGGDPNNPNSTHNWHYANPGQYNSENQTLTFKRGLDGDPTVSGSTSDDSFYNEGVEVKVSRWLHTWEEWDLDLDLILGLAWFPDARPMTTSRTTELNTTSDTYKDYFGSRGWQPSLDQYGTGYLGQFQTLPGDSDNPLIPLDPYSTSPGSIRDTVKVKGNFWHLRGEVGPMFTKPLTQCLSAYVAPQFALEFVDAEVRRTETVTENGVQTNSKSNHKSNTEFIPGFLLTAGIDYLITENWYVGGSFGWEWLSRDVKVKVGPDTATFGLEGGEFSLYLGRKF